MTYGEGVPSNLPTFAKKHIQLIVTHTKKDFGTVLLLDMVLLAKLIKKATCFYSYLNNSPEQSINASRDPKEELALTLRLGNCRTSVPWRRNPGAESGVDLAKSLIYNGARGRT